MQPPEPETLTTGNTTIYIALVFILNFDAESYARDPCLFWTKKDAATCARDVYHGEHRGVACTDFQLKLQCGKLFVILVFSEDGCATACIQPLLIHQLPC